MKNKVHLLITTDQEPNIGVLETVKMQIHNVSLVDNAEVVNKLKTALADHFDCDINKIKVIDLDVKSTIPLKIDIQCVIPDVTDCDDEIVVSLTQTYIY
jgi:hypothetical protein